MSIIVSFVSAKNVPFNVAIVRKGDNYGRKKCLTHDKDEPLIEFYDARYDFGPEGQFVSRYYAKTLLEGENNGLCLDGGFREWDVDAENFEIVREAVREAIK